MENNFKSGADFSRKVGMHRQNLTNWRKKYYRNLPEGDPDYTEGADLPLPNMNLDTLLPIIEVVTAETDISLYWLFTGNGQKQVSSVDDELANQFVDLREQATAARTGGPSQDEIVEYLLKNRKEIQNFLDTLPKIES